MSNANQAAPVALPTIPQINVNDVMDEVKNISRRLITKAPFYGYFMMKLNRSISEDGLTASVARNGINSELVVNPYFWMTLTKKQRMGIMIHEMGHLVYNHVGLIDAYPNHKVANIAMDLYINSQILEEYGEEFLPGAEMTRKDYKQKYKPVKDQIDKAYQDGSIDQETARRMMSLVPVYGCAPKDFELTRQQCIDMGSRKIYRYLMNRKGDGSETGDYIDSMVNQQKESPTGNQAPCTHKDWEEMMKGVDPADVKIIKEQMNKQVQSQVKQAIEENDLKSRGFIPGHLKAAIEAMFKKKPAIINWKTYLRRFIARGTERYIKPTRKRENRRIPGNPSNRRKIRQRVLVLVDTSASVSNRELLEGRNEIYHIQKLGFGVDVCEVDVEITDESIYEFKGSFRPFVNGRGGTDFTDAIDYYNKHSNKYSCAVYVTDGYCQPSGIKPKKPVLWLLTSQGTDVKSFKKAGHIGAAVKINRTID